jgi:lipoprotein NlpD
MMKSKKQRFLILLFTCLFISLLNSSCSSNNLAPVSSRHGDQEKKSTPTVKKTAAKSPSSGVKKPSHHKVNSGDTLYSISWNFNLDYKEVARWNNIRAPYVIYPGQSIRLTAPSAKKAVVKKTLPGNTKSAEKKPVEKQAEVAKKVSKKDGSVKYARNINWQWPTKGKLIKSNSPISKKGLDIAGKKGQLIKASGAGVVVYSGSGLLGYGRLIIIKHNETYLSAYAHNSALMVKEGDSVSGGQKIAKMGQDNNGQVLLHFEIRKNGSPVEPAKYLPKSQT